MWLNILTRKNIHVHDDEKSYPHFWPPVCMVFWLAEAPVQWPTLPVPAGWSYTLGVRGFTLSGTQG